MPKRPRSNGGNAEVAPPPGVSRHRFEVYITSWLDSVECSQTTCPSALPPLGQVLFFAQGPAARDTMRSRVPAIQGGDLLAIPPRLGGADGGATRTGVVYDELMLKHVSSDCGDLERPARLERTVEHLQAVGLLQRCTRLRSRTARTKDLRRVHSREHVDYVDQLDFFMSLKSDASASVGQDLYACEYTSRAARCATGSVVEAARAVSLGMVRNAMALVRPPGHHAGPDNSSGFCFYNNVAVAARTVQEEMTLTPDCSNSGAGTRPRIVIFDWDVHHCDGTENIFYNDPSVLVISIHQYANRQGHALRKLPTLPTGSGDGEITIEALEALLPPSGLAHIVPADSPASVKEEGDGEGGGGGRRRKTPVDYVALAAEIDANDDAAAVLFGVGSISSSSADADSTTDSGASDRISRRTVRYPGDTVGLSLGESGSGTAQSEGEDEDRLFYPGTGHLERLGGDVVEAARGRNVNIPWPVHGMGDLEYLQVLNDVVVPLAKEHAPDMFFISCGFDSARGDLLGAMNLTASGYYLMTKLLCRHFPRLVVALEGGYHVSNVARCSEAVLRALLEDSDTVGCERLPSSKMLWCQTADLVSRIKQQHSPFWQVFQDS